MTTRPDLHVAVLLTAAVQLLDLIAIDPIFMTSKEYLSSGLPAPLVALGKDIKISYIGPTTSSPRMSADAPSNEDNSLQDLIANIKMHITHRLDSAEVQPGEIHVQLIPGPDPTSEVVPEVCAFVRRHNDTTVQGAKSAGGSPTTILTICTGCIVAATAGIYDGRKVSAPRALVPGLRKRFPRATGDDERGWVVDAPEYEEGEGCDLE